LEAGARCKPSLCFVAAVGKSGVCPVSRLISSLVAVMGVVLLLAVVIPAIYQAREAARLTQCRNNLKQLGMALHNYHDAYLSFPPGTFGSRDFPPEHRWSYYVKLHPWLAQDVEPPINYLLNSRDSKNWPLTFEVRKHELLVVPLHSPLGTSCPNGASEFGEHQQEFASYVGVTGVGEESATVGRDHPQAGVWGYEASASLSGITSNKDQTILMIETASDRDVWLFGGRPTARWAESNEPQLGTGRTFGGLHNKGTLCCMVDGSTRMLSNNIDPNVFLQMTRIHPTATNGE